MTTDNLFRQKFHDSDAPGPQDSKHWMHRTHASSFAIGGLGAYGVITLGLAMWIIFSEFPRVVVTPIEGIVAGQEVDASQLMQLVGRRAEWEVSLLKLVLCVGGIGGLLHLLTSLGRFVGSRTLERSWVLFYLLRPPIGAGLGLLVYFILRMSVLAQGTNAEIPEVNVYGVLALSGLAGMFSRQAIEKLAEVFDLLFQKTRREVLRETSSPVFNDGTQETSGRVESSKEEGG